MTDTPKSNVPCDPISEVWEVVGVFFERLDTDPDNVEVTFIDKLIPVETTNQ